MSNRRQFDLREQLRRAKAIGEALRTPEMARLAEYLRQQAPHLQELLRWPLAWNSPPASNAPETSNPEPTSGNFAATEAADPAAVDGSVASAGNLVASEGADIADMGATRKKRRGSGRKPELSPEQIERIPTTYRAIRRDQPKLKKQQHVFEAVREQLNTDVSDTTLRTYLRRARIKWCRTRK